MHRFFYPSQDAAIYSEVPTRNTGLDEILEIGKTNRGRDKARSLIQFDITNIATEISASRIPLSASYELRLYLARATFIHLDQVVDLYPVSESWEEGDGYYYQDLYQEDFGTTWRLRESGSTWFITGSTFVTNSYSASYTLDRDSTDITIGVTDIINTWLSGGYANNGFLLKYPDADEENTRNRGNLRFFSKDSHTIYKPMLVAKWNDQAYSTGSFTASAQQELRIQGKDLRESYRRDETVTVYLSVRQAYEEKTFDNILTQYRNDRYLPETSYFSIVDEQSNVELISFDNDSRISLDASGSYVKFTTEAMLPLRYYRLYYKVVRSNGAEEIYKDPKLFTIRQR